MPKSKNLIFKEPFQVSFSPGGSFPSPLCRKESKKQKSHQRLAPSPHEGAESHSPEESPCPRTGVGFRRGDTRFPQPGSSQAGTREQLSAPKEAELSSSKQLSYSRFAEKW